MAKILLTGGTGYIGSHTAVELLTAGFEVVILDNLYNSEASAIDKIESITGKRPFFYEGNAADHAAVSRIFAEHSIDGVMHFAGYKAVGESVEKPLMYYENNLSTTICVLEEMQKAGCKRFIFSSSATVYGSDNPVPFTETQKAGGCTNPYGQTKFMIEQILQDYAKTDDELSIIILRYFNPIGCHISHLLEEQPKGVPNNLFPYIVQVARGERPFLNVFGNDYPTQDGTGVRDYIHVCDLASGHKAALDYALKHKGLEIINLGTGKGTSVLDLVKAFERANNVKIPYKITDKRAGDIAECYADVTKAKKLLNWEAKYTVEDACK